ncbi:MAG: hypothetical protein OEW15_14145 [Nitrospirota bacterium]|nr:hypothetical protein [Nitrospirota bacterium]
MRYLVIEQAQGVIPKEALIKSRDGIAYFNSLKKIGILIAHYHFAGIAGGAFIVDVNSNDQLGEILIKSPFYRFTTRTIYPLMYEKTMVQAEMKSIAKKGVKRERISKL